MQAIDARKTGQTQIRHHKPLPARWHDIGVDTRHHSAQGVNPCWLARQSLGQGQASGQILVDLLRHRRGTRPDFRTDLYAEFAFLIFHHRLGEIARLDRPQDIAVGDAVKRQV